jgi:hypothetical protein
MSEEPVQKTLGRIEGKIDSIGDRLTDHEGRLRSLEGSRWKLMGIAAGVSAAASVAWKWVTKAP